MLALCTYAYVILAEAEKAPAASEQELDVTVVLPALNEVGHIGAEVDRITKARARGIEEP